MAEGPTKKEPVLQYCVLCDNIAKEQTGKPVFVGVFDSILKPITVPQFFVVIKWVYGLGSHTFDIRILTPDLKDLMPKASGRFNLANETEAALGQLGFVNVEFKTAGVYWIVINLNDSRYAAFPLVVQKENTGGSVNYS